MSTLFVHVLAGMKDNNFCNDAKFKDWDNASHAIETYETSFIGHCSDEEMIATVEALNAIIDSDGGNIKSAVNTWNMAVWGSLFSDNEGSAPFNG